MIVLSPGGRYETKRGIVLQCEPGLLGAIHIYVVEDKQYVCVGFGLLPSQADKLAQAIIDANGGLK